jgi:hypothetical protein
MCSDRTGVNATCSLRKPSRAGSWRTVHRPLATSPLGSPTGVRDGSSGIETCSHHAEGLHPHGRERHVLHAKASSRLIVSGRFGGIQQSARWVHPRASVRDYYRSIAPCMETRGLCPHGRERHVLRAEALTGWMIEDGSPSFSHEPDDLSSGGSVCQCTCIREASRWSLCSTCSGSNLPSCQVAL